MTDTPASTGGDMTLGVARAHLETLDEMAATPTDIEVEVSERESDGAMLARIGTNGQLWAQEWIKVAERLATQAGSYEPLLDEGWMIGWFANAIEAGRSAGYHEARAPLVDPEEDPAIASRSSTALTKVRASRARPIRNAPLPEPE